MSQPRTEFLQRAVELALTNVAAGGGPFGAIVVQEEQVIAEGVNRVSLANDPTRTPKWWPSAKPAAC